MTSAHVFDTRAWHTLEVVRVRSLRQYLTVDRRHSKQSLPYHRSRWPWATPASGKERDGHPTTQGSLHSHAWDEKHSLDRNPCFFLFCSVFFGPCVFWRYNHRFKHKLVFSSVQRTCKLSFESAGAGTFSFVTVVLAWQQHCDLCCSHRILHVVLS